MYSLRLEPAKHFLNWQQDPHGNFLARAVFPEPTQQLSIAVDLVAEMATINPFDFFLEEEAEHWPFAYDEALLSDLEPFLELDPAGPGLSAWLDAVDRNPRPTVDFLVALNQRLANEIQYVIRLEPGVQTPRRDARLRARLMP